MNYLQRNKILRKMNNSLKNDKAEVKIRSTNINYKYWDSAEVKRAPFNEKYLLYIKCFKNMMVYFWFASCIEKDIRRFNSLPFYLLKYLLVT